MFTNSLRPLRLNKIENIQKDCWINLISPSEEELNFISKETGVPLDFFECALDDEETSHIDIDENGILQENILFRSPSYAAAFVIGGHVNGLVEWKTKDGVSLKEIENSEEN